MNLTGQQPYQKGQKRRRQLTEDERLDKEYRAWARLQPSCISGQFSEWKNGVGMCIAAHVRDSENSGTSYKPLFSAVSLTDAEHRFQHQHGEAACLNEFSMSVGAYTEFRAREWFKEQAAKSLAKWKKLRGFA